MGLPPRKDSISSGDSLRYQRLMQLTSKLQRSPSTPETPATPDGAAGVAAAGNNAENAIPSSPPPPTAHALRHSPRQCCRHCSRHCSKLMERCGGPGASAVIKQLVPTYEPDDLDLHRGFRK